jgi:hypothetical protein
VSPLLEEALKAAIVLWMVRRHRVAFLVDAAIHGFAVGTGFAVIENLVFWHEHAASSPGVWIARGAGTALMHGGATALVALAAVSTPPRRRNLAAVAVALLPRRPPPWPLQPLPALAGAVALLIVLLLPCSSSSCSAAASAPSASG